jgi:hypothetical protein
MLFPGVAGEEQDHVKTTWSANSTLPLTSELVV